MIGLNMGNRAGRNAERPRIFKFQVSKILRAAEKAEFHLVRTRHTEKNTNGCA